jgi:hypothetical protein
MSIGQRKKKSCIGQIDQPLRLRLNSPTYKVLDLIGWGVITGAVRNAPPKRHNML